MRLGTLDGHHDLRQGAGDDVDAVAVLGVEMDGGGKKWEKMVVKHQRKWEFYGEFYGDHMGILDLS